MIAEDIRATAISMLHQCGLANAWLALDPEHSIMVLKGDKVPPLLEFSGVEEPITGIWMCRFYIG